jgi:GH15 family glucan-1,4-alpha-glucosidase
VTSGAHVAGAADARVKAIVHSSPASIQDHAAIGDGRSVALVARDGTLDWLCWPRFDSTAVFSALLDPARGGYWRIAPLGSAQIRRRYREDTNVLETTFETADGAAVLTDVMTFEEAMHEPHPHSEHELVRRIACGRGSIEVEMDFVPRPDFGRARVKLRQVGALGVRCAVGSKLFALHSEYPLVVEGDRACARFVLHAGEHATFSFTFDDDIASIPLLGGHADARIEAAATWWRRWLSQLTYDGPDREVVKRSLLAVKLLSFAPSGAVIAAPTTSLPEAIGGEHNWDYRFCWLRDASFTARAFGELGFHDDAVAFCGWLLHATRLTRPELRILYDVYGKPPTDEQVLHELAGYRGSKPVRINNAASAQLQLDCYGEVLDAATWLHENDDLDRETQHLLADLGGYVLSHWQQPDQGIWEPRGAPQHRTHSRVLCWVAMDRLARLCRRGIVKRLDLDALERARHAIRTDIEAHGWSEQLQCYTDSFESDEVDASVLVLPYYGYTAATSPRMRSTFERIQTRLGAGPGLYLRNERSVRIGEGAFGICTAWAVDYLSRAGRHRDARATFDAFVARANDLGLYAEEIDATTGDALGNFPQAYTHVGLLSAALTLSRAPAATQLGDAA